jgi:hypothetical protein
MESLGQGDDRSRPTISFQVFDKLGGSQLIGSFGDSDVEMISNHHDIPALKTARGFYRRQPIREFTSQGIHNRCHLSPSARSSGPGQNGEPGCADGCVLDETGIGMGFVGWKNHNIQTGLFQSIPVHSVLFESQLIIRDTKIGTTEPIDDCSSRDANYGG